ncbi:hypothetical protein ACFW7X_004469 [Salmonella enterica]
MKIRKKFRPVDFKTNNMGNNYITIEGMMSANYKEHDSSLFSKCLKEVGNINRLLIDKRKCDNEKHYNEVLMVADICLAMMMIERRLGIVNEDNSFFNQR